MPKRKCFFEEPPKNRICSRISTGDTTSSKTGIPFRSSACHRSHRGRNLPTVGERSGLVKTRTQGRAIGASAACSPTWLIIQSTTASCTGCAALHAGRSWRSAKRAQAHATRPHRFRQQSHSAPHAPRFRPTRTHPFRHPTHPSVRNAPRYHPLPPGKVQPTSWYQQLTRTYIAPKPSIMRNKG